MNEARGEELRSGPRVSFGFWLVLLVIVNLLARLPLCRDAASVRNDGAEYLAIARQLRTTGRYATDLKYQFYTDDPIPHSAWADRPPVYPAFAALCALALPFLDATTAARFGSVLAACLALVLAALYLRRLFDERVALLAAGYVFLLPHTLYWTAQPMTEGLSLALAIGALLVWQARRDREGSKPGPGTALAAGILAGLGYLTRPTGLLLFVVLALDLIRPRRPRREKGRPYLMGALCLAGGFLLCAAPYHALLWHEFGSPFYSAIGYTFSVRNYYEVTYHGFERVHDTTLGFLREHYPELPGLILNQAASHAPALFWPLAGLLPFALRMRRTDWSSRRWVLAALAAATIAAHTLAWSAWGSSRYFFLALLFAVAALLWAAGRVSRYPPGDGSGGIWRFLGRALPAATALGLAAALAMFYARELRPDRGLPMLPVWREAAARVAGAGVIASDRPATLNVLTERPAVMLPRTTDRAQLQRFVELFRPDVMVLFGGEPEKASADAMAAAWRTGALPAGWVLDVENDRMLIAVRTRRAGAASGRQSSNASPLSLPSR